ncbi:hypothetical protein AAHB60_01525 [Pseudomonas aeruginosa]
MKTFARLAAGLCICAIASQANAWSQPTHKNIVKDALAFMNSSYATEEMRQAYRFYVSAAGSEAQAGEILGQAAFDVDDFKGHPSRRLVGRLRTRAAVGRGFGHRQLHLVLALPQPGPGRRLPWQPPRRLRLPLPQGRRRHRRRRLVRHGLSLQPRAEARGLRHHRGALPPGHPLGLAGALRRLPDRRLPADRQPRHLLVRAVPRRAFAANHRLCPARHRRRGPAAPCVDHLGQRPFQLGRLGRRPLRQREAQRPGGGGQPGGALRSEQEHPRPAHPDRPGRLRTSRNRSTTPATRRACGWRRS